MSINRRGRAWAQRHRSATGRPRAPRQKDIPVGTCCRGGGPWRRGKCSSRGPCPARQRRWRRASGRSGRTGRAGAFAPARPAPRFWEEEDLAVVVARDVAARLDLQTHAPTASPVYRGISPAVENRMLRNGFERPEPLVGDTWQFSGWSRVIVILVAGHRPSASTRAANRSLLLHS